MNAESVRREARPHKPSGLRFRTQQKGKSLRLATKRTKIPHPTYVWATRSNWKDAPKLL